MSDSPTRRAKPRHHDVQPSLNGRYLGAIRQDLANAGIPLGRYREYLERREGRSSDPLPAFTGDIMLRTARNEVPVYPVETRFDPSIIKVRRLPERPEPDDLVEAA